MNINDLFTDLVPYRPRQREEMPLLEWVKEFLETGFLKIDVYTSKKATENPNGYKASKVKSALINGFQSFTQEQRTLVQTTFNDSWVSLALDKNGFRQLVIASREVMEQARKNYNWRIDPLVRKIRVPNKEATEVSTTSQLTESEISEITEPKTDKSNKKGKKK